MSTYAAFFTFLNVFPETDPYGIFGREADNAESKAYLMKMRICFSSELTTLTASEHCVALVRQHIETVLCDLVSSLVDVETLMAFPSCNIRQMLVSGGHDLRQDLESLLSECGCANQMSFHNPDEEAAFMSNKADVFFDDVGANYNSQHLWSHCNQVAALLCEEPPPVYLGCGTVLREICSDINNCRLLERTPQISFERECLKRFIVLHALLKKLDRVNHEIIINTLLNCIFENTYLLTDIALYHEKNRARGCSDRESRLQRGKFVAIQKAYLSMSGSLLTLLLRADLFRSSEQSSFIRHFVFSFVEKRQDIRDYITEKAHQQPFLRFQLRMMVTATSESEKEFLRDMASDLATTFLSRSDDLLVHDIHRIDMQCKLRVLLYSTLATESYLHATDMSKAYTAIVNELILTPVAKMIRSPIWKNELQMAINHHVHYAEAMRTNSHDDNSTLVRYRESVLVPFLCENIVNNESPTLRKVKLHLLTDILKTFSSSEIKSEEKIYNAEGNLFSFMTYAKIAHSLKSSFEKNSCDSTVTDDIKTCAETLLSLPTIAAGNGREFVPLLQHAASCSKSDKIMAYITEFSEWMKGNYTNAQFLKETELELFASADTSEIRKAKPANPYAKKKL